MPTITSVEPDLGQAVLRVARALGALRAGPQTFGLDRRIDRAAYATLSRLVDSGTARASELAAGLGLDLSTVSRQVRTLEDAALIVRTTDPDDRRAAVLAPTPAGEELTAATRAKFSQLLEEALREWSDRDRRALASLLMKLADDMRPDRAQQLISALTEGS